MGNKSEESFMFICISTSCMFFILYMNHNCYICFILYMNCMS